MTVTGFFIQLLSGLSVGMVVFLIAVGLSLIFGTLRVLNLSHGSLYMLGAYVSYSVLIWTGQFWLCFIIAPFIIGAVGIILERFFLRKVHSHGHAAELLMTFGLAYIIEDVVKLILAGADVTMMTSALLKYGPTHLATVLFEMESWFAERDYTSVEQGKGSLSQASAADPEGFERTNYMRSLVTYSSRY